jgi:hypothetical protein
VRVVQLTLPIATPSVARGIAHGFDMVKTGRQTVYGVVFFLIWSLTSVVVSFHIDNKGGRCPPPLLQVVRGGRLVDAADAYHDTVCTAVATPSRRATIQILSAWTAIFPLSRPCLGFEGGIGGLGKTKPQTGAVLWDAESTPPSQSDDGTVSAELNVANRAVLVSFQSPWPLTGTVETRNMGTGESAFVQVVGDQETAVILARNNPRNGKEAMKQLLLDSVLAQQGKFGAYGSPYDIKIADYEVVDKGDNNASRSVRCTVTFTTLTPGLRESERQALIKAVDVFNDDKHWVLLVAGMTRQGFSKQSGTFTKVVDSFQVVPAPPSSLRRSQARDNTM